MLVEVIFTLLIMINPIGVLATYLSLIGETEKQKRTTILNQAILFSFVILLIAYFVGQSILSVLGITTYALQIAGGILFFKFGYDVLNGTNTYEKQDNISLVPLGFPVIAGPGSITTMILFASSERYSLMSVLIGVVVILSITYITLRNDSKITKTLGENATNAIVKIMGLFTISIGIQLVLTGLQTWLSQLVIIAGLA